MPKTTWPIMIGDPILRTCRHCHSRVAQPAMCYKHPRTCLTCCSSRLKRDCLIGQFDVPAEPYFPDMTWEERQADMARIRAEFGFRPLTADEVIEEAARRARP